MLAVRFLSGFARHYTVMTISKWVIECCPTTLVVCATQRQLCCWHSVKLMALWADAALLHMMCRAVQQHVKVVLMVEFCLANVDAFCFDDVVSVAFETIKFWSQKATIGKVCHASTFIFKFTDLTGKLVVVERMLLGIVRRVEQLIANHCRQKLLLKIHSRKTESVSHATMLS